jgi:branched-chain amino acid transport system ATP-binding protein
VATLPYGVQKRVDFARALVSSPKLLLLDEPLAGMNHEEKRDMTRFIRDVNERLGVTVVLIEHDIGVVLGLSHHVLVLDYGRKVGDGTPDQVRTNPDVIAAYLGTVH